MKTIYFFLCSLILTGCGSYYYFYSTYKDHDINEYIVGSIKTVLSCSIVGDNQDLTIEREAFDTANYKHQVYTSYVDSVKHIKAISYSFIIQGAKDTLAPDTNKNSLTFGEKPKDAFILKSPLSKDIELHVKYLIDSNGNTITRKRVFLLKLHRIYYMGKGLGGC
jgi:hypothetical protein